MKLEECGGLLVDLNFQNMVEASEQMQPQQAESQDFALIMIILMIMVAFLFRHLSSFRRQGMSISRANAEQQGATTDEAEEEETSGEDSEDQKKD